MLGLRLGEEPRALATTTPRSVPLLRRLLAEDDAVITRGRTVDNEQNLPARFLRDMRKSFGKSALARQELDGELLTDREGALWTRALIESVREATESSPAARTVVAVCLLYTSRCV